MSNITDISGAIFNSGLEEQRDAVIKTGSRNYSGKVIFRNPYQRGGLMGMEFESGGPFALCEYTMVDDWTNVESNEATIKIHGINGGKEFRIREKKPAEPNYVVLDLSYD